MRQCQEQAPSAEPVSLRFERRQCDRWPVGGAATAYELAGAGFGTTHPLTLVDYSLGGLGAVSATPVPPGTAVSVGFQAPGYTTCRGTVVRCLPCGQGYRVAIAFETRMAA